MFNSVPLRRTVNKYFVVVGCKIILKKDEKTTADIDLGRSHEE